MDAKMMAELERYIERHAEQLQTEADIEALAEHFMYGCGIKKAEGKDARSLLEEARQAAEDEDDLRERLIRAIEDPVCRLPDPEPGHSLWERDDVRDSIRLYYALMQTYAECGMFRPAVREGEEILRLCPEDVLRVRYTLAALYAALEETDALRDLHERCDAYDESPMLLPLAAANYRAGDLKQAEELLLRLARVNAGTTRFVRLAAEDPESIPDETGRPFTFGELAALYHDAPYLYGVMHGFFAWADRKLRK